MFIVLEKLLITAEGKDTSYANTWSALKYRVKPYALTAYVGLDERYGQ